MKQDIKDTSQNSISRELHQAYEYFLEKKYKEAREILMNLSKSDDSGYCSLYLGSMYFSGYGVETDLNLNYGDTTLNYLTYKTLRPLLLVLLGQTSCSHPARGESWRWNFSGYALTFPCIAWPFPLLGSARKNSPLSQRGEEKVTLTLRH